MFTDSAQRHAVEEMHLDGAGYELVTVETFGKHSWRLSSNVTAAMGTIPLGKTKYDLFRLLRRCVYNTALCPPLVHQGNSALRTNLALGAYLHRPISRPLFVAPSPNPLMTRSQSFGLLGLLLAVRLDRPLRRRGRRAEKTFLLPALFIAQLGLKTFDFLFQLINPTLFVQTKGTAVDRHNTATLKAS
jgi:hypothetical protein